MKDTQILKIAIENAYNDYNEIVIKDIAKKCNIQHINSNDLCVLCRNFCRKHPEYRLVKIVPNLHQNPSTYSLFEYGVLTCIEYD